MDVNHCLGLPPDDPLEEVNLVASLGSGGSIGHPLPLKKYFEYLESLEQPDSPKLDDIPEHPESTFPLKNPKGHT